MRIVTGKIGILQEREDFDMGYTKNDYEKYYQKIDKYRDFGENHRCLYHYLTRILYNSSEKAIECVEMVKNKNTVIFNGDEIRYMDTLGIPSVQFSLSTPDKLLSYAESRIAEYIKINNLEFNRDSPHFMSKNELLGDL